MNTTHPYYHSHSPPKTNWTTKIIILVLFIATVVANARITVLEERMAMIEVEAGYTEEVLGHHIFLDEYPHDQNK